MHIVQDCIMNIRKKGFCYAEDGKTTISAFEFEDKIKELMKTNGPDLNLNIEKKGDNFIFKGIKKK